VTLAVSLNGLSGKAPPRPSAARIIQPPSPLYGTMPIIGLAEARVARRGGICAVSLALLGLHTTGCDTKRLRGPTLSRATTSRD